MEEVAEQVEVDDEGFDPSAIASDKDKLEIKLILADDLDNRDVC